ncbi:putative variant ionotropic glutamate receptor-like 18 [Homarus americanus]|uniref:Putative variant ionotropic glutamate receptor-like 18 n=1 Tax=Homarus americanus TaxID=6706 RepID=A0A8J5MQY9_HOMAM|nr:putative variant ionotropic glutamate receptor-like 18 [Homarus americanus]
MNQLYQRRRWPGCLRGPPQDPPSRQPLRTRSPTCGELFLMNGSVLRRYGSDIDVVTAVAQAFNFTINFMEPPPGDVFPDQSEAQIPRWQSLALPYTATTWLVILLGLVLTGPLLYCLTKLASFSSLAYTSLYTAGCTSVYSAPGAHLLQPAGVGGVSVAVHHHPHYRLQLQPHSLPHSGPNTTRINTIKELYHSSLTVYGLGPFFGNNMAQSKNDHLRECFLPFNVALGLQSHSPLKKNFDRVVSWISQSGLMSYWHKQTLVLSKRYKRGGRGESDSECEVAGGGGVSHSGARTESSSSWVLYVAAQLVFMLEMFLCSRGNTL